MANKPSFAGHLLTSSSVSTKHRGGDDMAEDNVIALRPHDNASARSDMWDGLLRMMEANGRSKVEIGIEDVREIARLTREREQ